MTLIDPPLHKSANTKPGEITAQDEATFGRRGLHSSFRVGVDIGGTFTDVVLLGDDGSALSKKVSSTPDNYSKAVAIGIKALITEHEIHTTRISDIVHATTVATNAILEGQGPLTGLITTEGFRDVLEFRRVRFPELYNLDYQKPKPLVSRRHRLEVRERISSDGSIRIALDEATVIEAAEKLKTLGVEAVAICLLHSYLNPSHEKRIEEIIRDILPAKTFICCSCDVLPEIREYERTSTTVVNAFLGPVMSGYLSQLKSQLAEIGLNKPLYVMQSGGGQMSVSAALSKPAYLVESGPAAGVVAAAHVAKQSGLQQVITLDIGGTTAKTAIIENCEPSRTSEFEVGAGINLSSKLVKGAGYAIKLPFIDVSEIGAGGGSIVWFDDGGLLKVGPNSAGSAPGPVCYDRGGTKVTFTDAVLVMGYLNPDHLVGGDLTLQPQLAMNAIEKQVAARLNLSVADAAFGIFTVAVNNMVRAVKSVSTYRGRDPRDYTLISFGGNGPLVASAIASELGIGRVIVPKNPGVFSAYGLLVAETTHESVRSLRGRLGELDAADIHSTFDQLIANATSEIAAQGLPDKNVKLQCMADLRYEGQAFELTVPVDAHAMQDTAILAEYFHEEHFRTYGHKSLDQSVEVVNVRLLARVAGELACNGENKHSSARRDLPSERVAQFGPPFGELPTSVYSGREALATGILHGPMIIEEYDSTIVVPPGWNARVDENGNVVLSRGDLT